MKAYPLQWPVGWPRTEQRINSRFGNYNNKPSIGKASQYVVDEIRMLCGEKWVDDIDYVISSNLRTRLDGLPYSNQAQPDDPGIAVYFMYNGQQMVIACDTFEKIGCNLWAIGKTVEALRGIDRWGCSELMNRAFTGFKALPENSTNTGDASPWEILGVTKDMNAGEIKKKYRELCKKYHPDVSPSNEEYFLAIKNAYEEINAYEEMLANLTK